MATRTVWLLGAGLVACLLAGGCAGQGVHRVALAKRPLDRHDVEHAALTRRAFADATLRGAPGGEADIPLLDFLDAQVCWV